MIVLLSPSKKLDETSPLPDAAFTTPIFASETAELVRVMKSYNAPDLQELMKLSPKLAELNEQRYQSFDNSTKRPALYLFKGDVYESMESSRYSLDDLHFAQNTIRILSGLFGLLKPLDLMVPYRLEMGTKLKTNRGDTLYQFWGDKLTEALKAEQPTAVINLASGEYAKAIQFKQLDIPVIDIHFRQLKNGQLKNIGLMAKRARGSMANWMIKHRITQPEKLSDFNENGYRFIAEMSDTKTLTFVCDMDK